MIDIGVAATDIAVYGATAILGYIGMKAKRIKESQDTIGTQVDSLNEKLEKHDFILFGDEEISGYNGIQVVSYTNRAYLKDHHDALVEEGIIDPEQNKPTVTPDIKEQMQQ